MAQHAPEANSFKQKLRNSFERETQDSRSLTTPKNQIIYTCGDKSDGVYFIESGQIKLLMLSPSGKECLVAIYGAGDIFGELCLTQEIERTKTAKAMEKSKIKKIPCSNFYSLLSKDDLLEGFVKYLAERISDHQRIIKALVTACSEHRLGTTLLHLGKTLGEKSPRNVIIRHKISHRELSEMVGTTRPRISQFMGRFQKLNLIEMSPDRLIVLKEKRLTSYLAQLG